MPLTIHHLQVSQSERLVWLAEELSLPYDLIIHRRDPIFSPPALKALSPMGQAPIIQDTAGSDDNNNNNTTITLGESGACAEYILAKYGDGRLVVPPSHAGYADYLFWFHFANGSLQPAVMRLMAARSAAAAAATAATGTGNAGTAGTAGAAEATNPVVQRTEESMTKILKIVDDRLAVTGAWLAGADFTAADCMTVFTLTTMRTFVPLDLSAYTHVLEYLKRCTDREAYRRYRSKAEEEGMELMIGGPAPGSFVESLKARGKM